VKNQKRIEKEKERWVEIEKWKKLKSVIGIVSVIVLIENNIRTMNEFYERIE
jgi:hypothetical protein